MTNILQRLTANAPVATVLSSIPAMIPAKDNCSYSVSPMVTQLLKPNSWPFNFVEVSRHNLESSQTWGSCIQCLHNKPVSNHFCFRGEGGIKSVSRGGCEQQGGKLFRFFCQFHPRIQPLEASVTLSNITCTAHVCVCLTYVHANICKPESNFWITIANSF